MFTEEVKGVGVGEVCHLVGCDSLGFEAGEHVSGHFGEWIDVEVDGVKEAAGVVAIGGDEIDEGGVEVFKLGHVKVGVAFEFEGLGGGLGGCGYGGGEGFAAGDGDATAVVAFVTADIDEIALA